MITYRFDFFGFDSLRRIHGSAVVKALMPASLSTLLLAVFIFWSDGVGDFDDVLHPYVFQVFIAFCTYLITFRANFAYGRYWEAATAVHQMTSKWLDVGMNLASYHYQCSQYNSVRPPSFGKNAKLKNVTRERERKQAELSRDEFKVRLDTSVEKEKKKQEAMQKRFYMRYWKHINRKAQNSIYRIRDGLSERNHNRSGDLSERKRNRNADFSERSAPKAGHHHQSSAVSKSINASRESRRSSPAYAFATPSRPIAGRRDRPSQRIPGKHKSVIKVTTTELKEPSLFLQETAHLLSLLSAVAMSTLRRDVEGVETPLVEHIPGRPWPPVDPDQLGDEIRVQYHEESKLWTALYFLLGVSRSVRHRTLYNAARPFRVLGGVSDTEVQKLQQARGPYAKVALCSMWLTEFISREYMAGSTGAVAPPIISRVYQFTSDGMVGYNHCRKITYIPFPFAHAQMTMFFNFILMLIFPFLFYAYVNSSVYAMLLNFITVLCFVGLHEVARELEAPFENAPNDIPLTTFQAQFNEALICMYAGFHPDSWWEIKNDEIKTEEPALVVEVPKPQQVEVPEEEEEEKEETTDKKGPDEIEETKQEVAAENTLFEEAVGEVQLETEATEKNLDEANVLEP